MPELARVTVRRAVRWPPLPAVLVGTSTIVAFAWLCLVLLVREEGLRAQAYDLAVFEQVTWNVGHLRGWVTGFFPYDYLGIHVSPLLVLPALLELAWPDARLLSLLEAAATAAAAPAMYALSRALGGRPAVAAALAAPLPFWWALQESARSDFHPEALAFPLLLGAAAAAAAGRHRLMWALAAVAMLAKEDQAYLVLVVAGVAWVRPGGPAGRVHAAALAVFAVAWMGVVFGFLQPWLRRGGPVETTSYYYWLRTASPAAILAHTLDSPAGWLAAGGMLVSACLLPFRRPLWLLPALPPLVADLLSRHAEQHHVVLHYTLLVAFPVVVAAAVAAARLRLPRAVPAWTLVIPPLLVGLAAGALPPSLQARVDDFDRPSAIGRLDAVTAAIPRAAPVAADDDVAVRLAGRPTVHLLDRARLDDYLVIDREGFQPAYVPAARRAAVLAGLPGSRSLLADDGRFQVWSPAGGQPSTALR